MWYMWIQLLSKKTDEAACCVSSSITTKILDSSACHAMEKWVDKINISIGRKVNKRYKKTNPNFYIWKMAKIKKYFFKLDVNTIRTSILPEKLVLFVFTVIIHTCGLISECIFTLVPSLKTCEESLSLNFLTLSWAFEKQWFHTFFWCWD